MSEKDTAAETAAAHELVTTREGARMAGVAEAKKLDGRRRKGLTAMEERAIVALLRKGEDWRAVERRYGREIEPEVLAGWKETLEARAAGVDRPRMPSDK